MRSCRRSSRDILQKWIEAEKNPTCVFISMSNREMLPLETAGLSNEQVKAFLKRDKSAKEGLLLHLRYAPGMKSMSFAELSRKLRIY